jgi:hypothetical protein
MSEPLVVTFGGGRNGTGLLLGMYERQIKPDLIMFADTGGEKPETYRHIHMFDEWLLAHGMPGITTVRKSSKYNSLYHECHVRKTLPSLAFGWRSCSDKWKQEPQRKFLQHWEPAVACWGNGGKVRRVIGFHAGESHRAARFTEDEKYRNVYPLITWGWDNGDCIAAIERHGLEIPPKSACFFCPASTKAEVLALRRDDPGSYEAAVLMERNAAPTLVKIKGLGRHWSWENLQAAPDVHCVEQSCICFDE